MATCFIPPDIVLRSVRQDRHSDFVTFLLSILDPVVVEDLVRDYQLGVTVLKRSATREDREAHIDIADWLLRYMFEPVPFCHSERSPEGGVEESPWRREFLKIADVLSPESHAEVEALIEELGLEVWRVEKVEGEEMEEPP